MSKISALIGNTGYVGSTLLQQTAFDYKYRSTNIGEICNQHFDTVICAGAPAQKWIANREPEKDKLNIDGLISNLKTISCKTFVLISTVDVFPKPIEVDEKTIIDESRLHAYGAHRLELEKFIQQNFANYLIIRLPGLVGPGLRKNVIFDFLNKNNLHAIDSRWVFQFYPMQNLWQDIQTSLDAKLSITHLTAEPISVVEVAELGFGIPFNQLLEDKPIATYDMRTIHANIFGKNGNYQYTKEESINAIQQYAKTETPKNITT